MCPCDCDTQQDAKLAREIDASEKVSLGVAQFFKKVEDDASWTSVSQNIYDAQMKKLTDRLTPDLNVLYSQGYDSVTQTAGVRCYEEFEQHMAKLKSLEGLIKSFYSTEGDWAKALALQLEYKS